MVVNALQSGPDAFIYLNSIYSGLADLGIGFFILRIILTEFSIHFATYYSQSYATILHQGLVSGPRHYYHTFIGGSGPCTFEKV